MVGMYVLIPLVSMQTNRHLNSLVKTISIQSKMTVIILVSKHLKFHLGLIIGEIEADWLSEVGLGEWTQQWRQGKSLPENDIGPAVQKLSLKPHQVKQTTYCCFSLEVRLLDLNFHGNFNLM